jgi:hypothetical protein
VFDDRRSFITRAFLLSEFALDYRTYTAEHDAEVLKRLQDWDGRLQLSETQAEALRHYGDSAFNLRRQLKLNALSP